MVMLLQDTSSYLVFNNNLIIQQGYTVAGQAVTMPISVKSWKIVVCVHVGSGQQPISPSYEYARNKSQNYFLAAQAGWSVQYVSVGH